jgi:AcrR family transcriptional regulator
MANQRRTYELKERARKQAETRRRIVEATAALHEEVGPARTTVAEIARRAGVQRLTVYNHFPDDRELFGACSAHFLAEVPPPNPGDWAAIPDPAERVRVALGELHGWYRERRVMLSNVERDSASIPALREVVTRGQAPWLAAIRDVLAAGWNTRGARRRRLLAAIDLATSFAGWERLAADQTLSATDIVEVLAGAVEAAAGR